MNRYKIITNFDVDGYKLQEADKFDVSKTGQLRFYNFDDNGCDLVAVFPATCAVIKIEEEIKSDCGKYISAKEDLRGGVSEVISIPAGNANTVYNEPLL